MGCGSSSAAKPVNGGVADKPDADKSKPSKPEVKAAAAKGVHDNDDFFRIGPAPLGQHVFLFFLSHGMYMMIYVYMC